jgi:hypothetical protein
VYPELFLIVSVIIYWALTGTLVNPVAISLFALLVAQLRFKNKIFGIVLSVIFMLLCMYMMLAIFSDIVHLDTFFSKRFINDCFWGLVFWFYGIFCPCLTQKK